MDKKNCTYTFTETFTDVGGQSDEATVSVEIDYTNNMYSIKPTVNNNDTAFKILQVGGSNWRVWMATIAAIGAAQTFANAELGFS